MFFILLSEIESFPEKLDFTLLYATYKPMMYSIAMSILHNREDAEDAVIEAFESAYIHERKIAGIHDQKTKSFLAIIVKNKALDIYRKNQRNETVELPADLAAPPDKLSGYGELAELIADLEQPDRDIIKLRIDNELKYKEIGEMLKMSPDAVRMRYKRCLQKLADEIRGLSNE